MAHWLRANAACDEKTSAARPAAAKAARLRHGLPGDRAGCARMGSTAEVPPPPQGGRAGVGGRAEPESLGRQSARHGATPLPGPPPQGGRGLTCPSSLSDWALRLIAENDFGGLRRRRHWVGAEERLMGRRSAFPWGPVCRAALPQPCQAGMRANSRLMFQAMVTRLHSPRAPASSLIKNTRTTDIYSMTPHAAPPVCPLKS